MVVIIILVLNLYLIDVVKNIFNLVKKDYSKSFLSNWLILKCVGSSCFLGFINVCVLI